MAPYIVGALIAVVILKPQEFIPALQGIPLVYVLFGASILAIGIDIVWKRIKPSMAPQIPYVAAFFLWAAVTTAVKRPEFLEKEGLEMAIVFGILVVVSLAVSSARGLRVFAVVFVGCAVAVTAVSIQQGFSDYGCLLAAPDDWEGKGELEADGRPCQTVLDCRKDAPVPDGNYRCERVGPWQTASIGGRVRYRGSLADPNELSLMIGMSIPFAFVLTDRVVRRRRAKREEEGEEAPPRSVPAPGSRAAALPLLLSDRLLERLGNFFRRVPVYALLVAIAVAVVLSKSRSGVIVFLIAVGAQFIRKAGGWGVVAGLAAGPPLLLVGGRSGEDAEASSDERVQLLYEGFEMLKQTKGIGVGAGQFADESSIGLTAHNSYVLAAAEAGLVGMILFAFILYLSVKIPFRVWFADPQIEGDVRSMAPAIGISLLAALAGIFFLSWSYKDILYMVVGASAALYAAARAKDPSFRVGLTGRELVLVPASMFALLGALFVLVRIKL